VNYDKSGSDQRGQAAERVLSCLSVSHEFIGALVSLAVIKHFVVSGAALAPEALAAKKEFNMPLELYLACEDAALCEDATQSTGRWRGLEVRGQSSTNG
jgi:hypothetical protein